MVVVTDLVAASVGTAAAAAAHVALNARPVTDAIGMSGGAVIALSMVALWMLCLAANGGYARRYVASGTEEYRAVTRGALAFVAVAACSAYLAELPLPRSVVVVGVPVMLVVTALSRWQLRRRVGHRRLAGSCLQPTLLVGETGSVLEMAEHITREPADSGMRVVGACVTDPFHPDVVRLGRVGIPVLGSQHDTLEVVEKHGVETVAVASSPELSGVPLRRLGWALEQQDVDLLVAPGLVEVAGPRLTTRPAAGVPMIHIERPVSGGLRYTVKLVFDRLVALALLLVAAPFLGLVALLVRRDSDGPAFFTQNRVGEGGRIFRMIKFRTMVVDAEQRLAGLAEDGHEQNETLFKLQRDPRITRLGAFLRRFSIDELPQLFNVLRGDMSLIGPRPPLLTEVDMYESDAVRRLRVRPGMTGLWQVSGRSDLSWGDSVRLDLWYVDNWSLTLDVQILVRTVDAVLRGRGAY